MLERDECELSCGEEVTDNEIQSLINLPKFIKEDKYRKIKVIEKTGFKRFNLEVEALTPTNYGFVIFYRQAVDDPMDFSFGLRVDFQDNSSLILMRCNGIHVVIPYKSGQKNIQKHL